MRRARPRAESIVASIAAIAVAVAGSGCSLIVHKPRPGSVLADVCLGLVGVLVLENKLSCSDQPNDCEGPYVATIGAVVFLPIALISGAIALQRDAAEEEREAASRPAAGSVPDAPPRPPAPRDPVTGVLETSVVHRTPTPPSVPLPEVPTDETTLRLAKQVRSAATAGQCASAWRTMAAIAARDARYHAALEHGPILDACR